MPRVLNTFGGNGGVSLTEGGGIVVLRELAILKRDEQPLELKAKLRACDPS